MDSPRTLQEAIIYFADTDACLKFFAAERWPDGVICPTCGSKEVKFIPTRKLWECKHKHSRKQFSIKVGTIFEDSPLGLDKWLPAVWLITCSKNGVSSCEIARSLGITQKSAWFMLHRIRLALQSGSLMKVGGEGAEVEVDETFIGGKARNMHVEKRKQRITARGGNDKTIVFGVLERGGKVQTKVIANPKAETVQPIIRDHVEPGAALSTDTMLGYWGLDKDYAHQMVDDAVEHVNGRVHTNGLENFWSLLKRGLNGT